MARLRINFVAGSVKGWLKIFARLVNPAQKNGLSVGSPGDFPDRERLRCPINLSLGSTHSMTYGCGPGCAGAFCRMPAIKGICGGGATGMTSTATRESQAVTRRIIGRRLLIAHPYG